MNKSEQKHAMLNKTDKCNKPFFYSASILSSNSEHAGKGLDDIVYYYNVLYNMMMVQSDRARLQAESITDDSVLADLIAEQILMYAGIRDSCSPEHSSGFHYPSIIELEGGLRIC